MLQNKEKGNFEKLLLYTHRHPSGEFVFCDNAGTSMKAYYDTDYETDNGLELSDLQYEEYIGIAFKNAETGNLFEINYKCLPASVFCDGKKVF